MALPFAVSAPLAAQTTQVVRMESGLVISAITDSRLSKLEVAATYSIGSRQDPDTLQGLAHLTEHLAMRETRNGESIAVMLSRLGVRAGAVTTESRTAFTFEAPPAESLLSRILEIERMRQTSLAFSQQPLDVERRRILAEVGPTRHRDLARIRVGDVVAFHGQHYRAANCSITVRSPIPAAIVMRLAEARFGPPVNTTRVAPAAPAGSQRTEAPRWAMPESVGLTWHSAGNGLQWVAAAGGDPDSVHFAIAITVPPVQDVAALEVFARSWSALRLRTGRLAADSLAALGSTIDMSPLPYLPLATADAFRMLGTTLTPLGVAGVQISGAARRHSWAQAIALVADAILNGELRDTLVTAEIGRQRGLLAAALNPLAHAEVAFRRTSPALPPRASAVWRPAPVDTQLAIMRALSVADVRRIQATLAHDATARVAVLGVPSSAAAVSLGDLSFAGLGGQRVPRESPSCGGAGDTRLSFAALPARSEVFFALCIPAASDARSAAAYHVVNALLGGREDALLAGRLRMQTGLVYAFESRLLSTADDHALQWHLRVGTQTSDVDEVIEEVRRVLNRVSSEAIAAERFEDFREAAAQQRLRRSRNGRAWTEALLFGASPEAEAAAIRAVTLAEVNAALKLWSPDRLAITALASSPR